jgi:hypothetical protein
MMEAVCTSETSIYSDETARSYIPEGPHLQPFIVSHGNVEGRGHCTVSHRAKNR